MDVGCDVVMRPHEGRLDGRVASDECRGRLPHADGAECVEHLPLLMQVLHPRRQRGLLVLQRLQQRLLLAALLFPTLPASPPRQVRSTTLLSPRVLSRTLACT